MIPKDVIGYIVANVDSPTVPDFLNGLHERVTAMDANPTPETIAAVDEWLTTWSLGAFFNADPDWRSADKATPVGRSISGDELRARVKERRLARSILA